MPHMFQKWQAEFEAFPFLHASVSPRFQQNERQNLWQEGKRDTNFLISVRGFEYVNDIKYYHVLFCSRGSQSAVQWDRQQSLPAPH